MDHRLLYRLFVQKFSNRSFPKWYSIPVDPSLSEVPPSSKPPLYRRISVWIVLSCAIAVVTYGVWRSCGDLHRGYGPVTERIANGISVSTASEMLERWGGRRNGHRENVGRLPFSRGESPLAFVYELSEGPQNVVIHLWISVTDSEIMEKGVDKEIYVGHPVVEINIFASRIHKKINNTVYADVARAIWRDSRGTLYFEKENGSIFSVE